MCKEDSLTIDDLLVRVINTERQLSDAEDHAERLDFENRRLRSALDRLRGGMGWRLSPDNWGKHHIDASQMRMWQEIIEEALKKI